MKSLAASITTTLSAAALLTGSLAANAAEIPVRTPIYKAPPPPVTVWNWTGFYVGGNVGYSRGESRNTWNVFAPNALLGTGAVTSTRCPPFTAVPPFSVAVALCGAGSDSARLNGVIGGLQAGYN